MYLFLWEEFIFIATEFILSFGFNNLKKIVLKTVVWAINVLFIKICFAYFMSLRPLFYYVAPTRPTVENH